ncbi:MAG: glycoside hydrolase family 65 protein [Tyzzerella sp.]|nr:glycoside hydrolase family 65 protein [Tyzzerella sp.]
MRDWMLIESGFQKEYVRKYESIMSMGNGYMGVRATTEESYERAIRYTLVAGTFDAKEDENTTELPNAADTTALFVTVNGIPLHLTQENTENYQRSLSLSDGLLKRSFVWSPSSGLRLEFCSERFVSLKELHVLGHRMSIKVLEGCGTLELQSGILGGDRYGSPHFTAMQGQEQDGIMQYAETTHESNITFVTSATVDAWMRDKDGIETPIDMTIDAEKERVMSSCRVVFEEGQEFHLEKLCRIATTRDKDFELASENVSKWGRDLLLHREKEEMEKLRIRGYEKTWKLSQDCWKELWSEKDVIISGEKENAEYDQLAVRFAIYHLTIMAPLHDNRMNIGAKGLSGKGYYGHTFWDTEIYMLPYYAWENPKGARSLLEYRYLCLDSARENARESGFEGAKYPWEAAWITDGDTCPKKHFTQYELHVTADVAYGIYYYYEITHDIDFMRKYGCEILFETAQFWRSRLEYNAEKDVYEIRNVIGPDEFTHEANNNAYTNYLAHLNLKFAIEWKERLQRDYPEDYERLNEKLNLGGRMKGWLEGRDKLVLPVPNEDNILPQDDDYMTLPEIDLSIYRRKEKKLRVDYPYPVYTRLKVSKQADVMNLFLLLEELFTDEVKRASLAYYEPFCVHESSLSLCAYSMLAADCGENKKAYELFVGARDIDLKLKNDSDHGIHAASLGGIWQCCVLGFAGVRMCGGKLRIRPNLPKHWESVKFRMWWRGSQLEVTVTKDNVAYEVLQGSHIVEIETK